MSEKNPQRQSEIRSLLEVYNTETKQHWEIREQYPANRPLIYSFPWPLAWAKDGQHLFITHRIGGRDGCFGEEDSRGGDLLKVNLQTGEIVELLPEIGYWLAISPNEQFIAYLNLDDVANPVLGIRDLRTGQERTIPVEGVKEHPDIFIYASNLIWSQDSAAIFYATEVYRCLIPEAELHSIVRVDVETLQQITLVRESELRPIPIRWQNEGVILQDENGTIWWMNPTTGQMSEQK